MDDALRAGIRGMLHDEALAVAADAEAALTLLVDQSASLADRVTAAAAAVVPVVGLPPEEAEAILRRERAAAVRAAVAEEVAALVRTLGGAVVASATGRLPCLQACAVLLPPSQGRRLLAGASEFVEATSPALKGTEVGTRAAVAAALGVDTLAEDPSPEAIAGLRDPAVRRGRLGPTVRWAFEAIPRGLDIVLADASEQPS